MGKWAWTWYARVGGVHLRIIFGYRPNNRGGKRSVFNQQERMMLGKGDTHNPRWASWEDLRKELKQWKEQGNQLIVMLDANEDVLSPLVTNKLEDSYLDLVNVHLLKHSSDAPATRTKGSNPIDGIWATRGLSIKACG